MTESERALLLAIANALAELGPDWRHYERLRALIATVRREAAEAERGMGR